MGEFFEEWVRKDSRYTEPSLWSTAIAMVHVRYYANWQPNDGDFGNGVSKIRLSITANPAFPSSLALNISYELTNYGDCLDELYSLVHETRDAEDLIDDEEQRDIDAL